MAASSVLVLSRPTARYLRLLERLPEDTHVVVGDQLGMFEAAAGRADVLLNCFSPLALLREVFLRAPRLKWVHSLSVGVENTLFPELVASAVPLTNARGVYSRSLAEFVLAGALFFSKKLDAMRRQQAEGRWVDMEVDELAGKTMGIVSYGSIGQATARLARAFGMRVLALRRRPELALNDALVDEAFGPEGLGKLLARSDFVVVASPLTPQTRGMIGAAQLAAMKPEAVLINIGRGPVIVEEALVECLRAGRIRGAVLDVFDTEPLPEGHPYYAMENVLLSPHSADHVPGWTEQSMKSFLANFERYRRGEPLENLVDKQAGY